MDSSGQKLLLDITIMNRKCMPWQERVMKQLTDDSSSSDAYQILTGINYTSMVKFFMQLPILHSWQLWIMSHCFRWGIMKIFMCHHNVTGNKTYRFLYNNVSKYNIFYSSYEKLYRVIISIIQKYTTSTNCPIPLQNATTSVGMLLPNALARAPA